MDDLVLQHRTLMDKRLWTDIATEWSIHSMELFVFVSIL